MKIKYNELCRKNNDSKNDDNDDNYNSLRQEAIYGSK